jgi:hypothetical protein
MMYLRGALDSAQYFIAWEEQLSIIKMHQENLADIKHKLSIIYVNFCVGCILLDKITSM